MAGEKITFDYVVFDTGYTGRLKNTIEEEFKNEVDEAKLLFTWDDLHGHGVNLFSNERDKNIQSILKTLKTMSMCGVICFKLNQWIWIESIVNILKNQSYCSFGPLYNVEIVKCGKFKILCLMYDCESG